jgi:class 3 adenylate cyclase/tetratricopeptide (TPR) repeat protein
MARPNPPAVVAAGPAGEVAAGERLKPYVPRLVIDWLRGSPDLRHRLVDGSLAFVDISGFTQLTEKLARRGKVGAEEVSDTLQTIFTQLLDVAYDYDGGLLKWGGDALLVLFEGPGHAQRACRAVAGMQQTLDRIGTLRAGGATVTLRMSVGIHSGRFDFFLVGESHRELIVTGPGASTTVAMESIAEAGEVAVSAATAELVGDGLAGRRKGNAVVVERIRDVPLRPAPDVGDVSDIDLPSCIPAELRKQLLVEQGEAEHRTVSVAFVRFSGTDGVLAGNGPAALAESLHELVAGVQEACERFAVTFFATDINADGGKIILVTGAPWSGGDDEERLLRAVRMIADRGGIPVRIGVNSGRAFTCDFGPAYRRTYQIYGDAVNLAARIMAKGRPGQVLATDATLSRARTAYRLEELEPFTVKGKAEPVRASVVGAVAGTREAARRATPLVGREEEMAVLMAAAGSARSGEGRVVELVGEPGIGKSRLVEELESRSAIQSFRATCEQYESSTPYFPFRGLLHDLLHCPREARADEVERALRSHVGSVAPELGPWLPLLGTALGHDLAATPETASLDERFVPERTADAVCSLLAALRPEPTLLVFDDVHWLDEASAGALARIAEEAASRPWLVLVTRREVDGGFAAAAAPHAVVLRPQPLSAEAVEELATVATEDVPLPPHVLEALAERSGGNPLFLTELIAASLAGAGLDELPDSVEALMAAHIDRLEPGERTVLRYAAVLGATVETGLLLEALEGEVAAVDADVWSRLGEFLGEDEPGVLRFRHALIRDAAYEGLPYRRRRALHARVAETIERRAGPGADDEAERLSLHYFHAHDTAAAWRYSRVAGERALGIYANVEAAAFFERALRAAGRFHGAARSDVAAVAESLGDVRVRLGEFEAAGEAYRAARRQLPADPVEEARLMLKHALIPWRLGRHPQALRWLTRGLRVIDGLDEPSAVRQRARLYAWKGVVKQKQGYPLEAIGWCERAIEAAEASGARDALAQSYYMLDWAYAALGRFEEAVYSQRALAIYEELGDLERQALILNNLGVLAHRRGRWGESIDLYDRAQEAWEKAGDRWSASFAVLNRAEVLLDQGRLGEAEPLLRESLRIARASRSGSRIADAAGYYGRLLARLGRFDEARSSLAEARAQHERDGERGEVLETEARIAEALLLEGAAADALEQVERTLARARTFDGIFALVPTLERVRGLALMQLGRPEEARAALTDSLDRARLDTADYDVALALDSLAALGRLTGEPASAFERERDAIFRRLGVVASPELPLRPDAGPPPATRSG